MLWRLTYLRCALVVPVIVLALAGCGGETTDSDITQPAPTAAPAVTDSGPAPTATARPATWTPVPTSTRAPARVFVTSTAVPTGAPLPSVTASAMPPVERPDLPPITASNAAQLQVLAEGRVLANNFAWNSDGSLLAAAERDGVRLFPGGDVANPVRLLANRGDWIGHSTDCTAISPDGQRVLAGNTEGELRVWDAATYALLDVIDAHDMTIWDCAYSPDGTRLATGSDDNTVKLWDAASLALLATLPIRDGRDSAFDVAWSPDGTLIGVGSNATSTVYVWDVVAQEEIFASRGYATMAWAVAFSPDGQWFAAGYSDGVVRVFRVRDLGPDAEPVAELGGHEAMVQTLAFNGTGDLLAVGVSIGVLHLWDVATWTAIAQIQAHETGLDALRFAPDGARLYTSGYDETVRVWSAQAER